MGLSGETRKNLLLVLASAVLSLVLGAAAVEGYYTFKYLQWKKNFETDIAWLGALTIPSDNPVLMWEYRPNAQSTINKIPQIKTNRYGFRDYDYETPAKPADVYRVSFIGDSVTLGYGVREKHSFVSRIAVKAREKRPDLKLQTLNHGVDGYNTIQIYELLRTKVLQFEPDKVVYVMCPNDFDFEDSSGNKIRYFKKPKSFLWKKAEQAYRNLMNIDFHLWHFWKNRQQVFDKIVEMKNLLHERNIEFQVVILPVFNENFAAYTQTEMHSEIRRFLKKERIEYFDLLDSFTNLHLSPYYFAYDAWHPKKEGHDLIAEQLLPFVIGDRKNQAEN